MDVTKHCRERYVERIKGINNSIERKEYIANNQEQIDIDINKLFEFAKFIDTEQIGGDKTSKNFYINDNIILVVNTENTVIITLYKVDFGFSPKTNRNIIKDLLEEIEEEKNNVVKFDNRNKEYRNSQQLKIDEYKNKISELEESISLYKTKINSINNEIYIQTKEGNISLLKLKDRVNKLCNSIEYKNDLKQLNK